jgi:hypothetical protein
MVVNLSCLFLCALLVFNVLQRLDHLQNIYLTLLPILLSSMFVHIIMYHDIFLSSRICCHTRITSSSNILYHPTFLNTEYLAACTLYLLSHRLCQAVI